MHSNHIESRNDQKPRARYVRLEFFLGACVLASIAFAIAILAWTGATTGGAPPGEKTPSLASVEVAVEAGEYAQALPELKMLVERGVPSAQRLLGQMYRNGQGVPPDIGQSFRLLLAAAEKGDPEAQNAVAEMYAYGYGVEQDVAKAAEWSATAARSGYGAAGEPGSPAKN